MQSLTTVGASRFPPVVDGKALFGTMSQSGKVVVVMLQSLAGTGHRLFRQRPKLAEKLEFLSFDPFVQQRVLYKEVKKVKTLRSKGKG